MERVVWCITLFHGTKGVFAKLVTQEALFDRKMSNCTSCSVKQTKHVHHFVSNINRVQK